MKNINLHDHYPHLTNSPMIEVPDELSALLQDLNRKEDSAQRQIRRYIASTPVNEIPQSAISADFWPETPEDIAERKFMYKLLYKGLATLSAKQSRRIYAYFFLNMRIDEIARTERVGVRSVYDSIAKGLKRLEKFFQKNL